MRITYKLAAAVFARFVCLLIPQRTCDRKELVYKRDVEDEEETSEFCTMSYAAQRSGVALKTWYEGGAGTNSVPRIRFGRSIRLLRKDVDQFILDRIQEARNAVDQKKQT